MAATYAALDTESQYEIDEFSDASAALITADDGTAPAAPRGCCGLYAQDSALHPEWREPMLQHRPYVASPFAYCLAGGLLALRPEPLERGLPLFPWRVTALSIVLNGFLSFMADVETWGRPSAWRVADRVFATTNTVLMATVVLLGMLGHTHFATESVACLGSGVAVGLVCKQRASAAMARADCDGFLLWHSLWHYTLPFGAILGQLVIHRACDYALAAPHGTGSCEAEAQGHAVHALHHRAQ